MSQSSELGYQFVNKLSRYTCNHRSFFVNMQANRLLVANFRNMFIIFFVILGHFAQMLCSRKADNILVQSLSRQLFARICECFRHENCIQRQIL